jgi:hypothetical protein
MQLSNGWKETIKVIVTAVLTVVGTLLGINFLG